MKTFLTICTCAMISAGLYGFIDMAGDVRNGTMIRYDHGDEQESLDVADASADVALLNDAKLRKKVAVSSKIDAADKKAAAMPTIKKKSQKKIVKKEEPVIEKEEEKVPVSEIFTTEVIVDSVPGEEIVSSFEIDYSDFSRGAPRKSKKSKKSKKD